MWASEVKAAEQALKKFGCNPLTALAIDVGGGPNVVVDDRPQANPLLKVSPRLEFLDQGFIVPYGGRVNYVADFLNGALLSELGLKDKYDLTYSFQTLEHVRNPFVFARNLVFVAAPSGFIWVSTVFSFPYHPSPEDYWRFSPTALRLLFEGTDANVIWSGWGTEPGGVMLMAQREPSRFTPRAYPDKIEEFLRVRY